MSFLTLLKWAKNVPKLFAHFPGPTLVLVFVAMLAAGTVASCVTNKLNAGTLAETKIELAECRAQHAETVAKAAGEREGIIEEAARRQAANDAVNREVFLAMARALSDTRADDAALAALSKSIEDLHRDPTFACRLLPLPESHLDRLRIGAEKVVGPSGEARGH